MRRVIELGAVLLGGVLLRVEAIGEGLAPGLLFPNGWAGAGVLRPAMKAAAFAVLLGLCSVAVEAASGTRITSGAAAIEMAKRYLRSRCTVQTPCRFKAEHEGKQWRVWVQLTRRDSPSATPRPFPGGTVILYFGEDGSLKRRLEAD